MSVPIPLFEKADSKPSKGAAGVEEVGGERFDVKKFVENFDVLAQAGGSVKRLREMVLGLAVRGALVPQLPDDGTSDSLVEELVARRLEVLSTARVRGDLTEVHVAEQPFMVPPSWRWLRLGHLGGFLGGGTPAKSNTSFWDGTTPWVSPKDMKKPYIDDAEDHISEAAVEGSAVKLIPKRSLLFVVRGMILAHSFPVAMTTKMVTINQDMKALVLAVPEVDEYLLRACWAARTRVLQRVERSSHGTCRLESEVVEELPIPIPPLAEQKRIVAKVDELMRLLDDLEAKQTKTRETQARLRTAALGALTFVEGPEEFEAAWKRVAENFEVLFGAADAIRDLRRTVLGLACRGTLTSREPGDGTGAEVVERIEVARRTWALQATKVGNTEGARLLKKIAEQRVAIPTLPLPSTWTGATLLAACCQLVDCHNKTAPYTKDGVMLVRTSNVRDGRILLDGVKYVSEATYKFWSRRCPPAPGDLLLTREAPMGEAGVVQEHMRLCMGQRMMLLRTFPELLDPKYLLIAIQDPAFQERMVGAAVGSTVKHLRVGDVEALVIPVPPVAEQKRIVAKVDHLMKLCDELEAKLHRTEMTAAKLVEAVIAVMAS